MKDLELKLSSGHVDADGKTKVILTEIEKWKEVVPVEDK